ncbi:MAG: sigma 54-interacting transcriptional regulator [Polyangiaceae bacterium]
MGALEPRGVSLADAEARGEGGAGARLAWWGARADVAAANGGLLGAEEILAALVSLASREGPLAAKGRAMASGMELARHAGRPDLAARLGSEARVAARAVVARNGDDAEGDPVDVRRIPWVAAHADARPDEIGQEQVRDLERLVRSLGSGERLGVVLRRVVDALVLWTGVERGLLLLRAPDGRLIPRAARNFARADLDGEQRELPRSLARRALEAEEPIVAVDASGELASVHASVHALKLRSVLAVPLLTRGEPIGVVYLDDRVRRGAFGPRELAWVKTIATLAASMIADARDQVLLRRAIRRGARANAALEKTLAEREARLDQAERSLVHAKGGRGARNSYDAIVGESEPVRALLRLIDRVAPADVPVLVSGESGSGKELVARAIHEHSDRRSAPFVSENCGAIPEGLLESLLFGHARGAFTGAHRSHVGLFEAADGGTLFLDEIGEMGLSMQTKLLRVLEDGLVRPVGGDKARRVSVRVIAATNRDLEKMVQARTFREDLFYRLDIIRVAIPPLRARPNDIPLLVHHMLQKHGKGRRVRVTPPAMQRLVAFGWPGNVRQLENEIRRALVLADDTIDPSHLTPEIGEGANAAVAEAGLDVKKRIDLLEATLVREALARTRGNQTRAAKLLGLSRFGLQKMVKRLGIPIEPE